MGHFIAFKLVLGVSEVDLVQGLPVPDFMGFQTVVDVFVRRGEACIRED